MSDHNLKMCACGNQYQYECARCRQTFCLACDRPVVPLEIKTIARYCPDPRCQREKKIEDGDLAVVSRRPSWA